MLLKFCSVAGVEKRRSDIETFTLKHLIFFLSIILIPLFSGCTQKQHMPVAEKGRMDLSGWNFLEKGPVPLNGQWEFYWSMLLTPLDFEKGPPEKTGYLELPGSWKGFSHEGRPLSGEGYATFRLSVDIPSDALSRVFQITDIGSVCRIWVNGVPAAASGTVGTSPETEIPRYHQLISSPLPGNAGTLDIIMQVSNFHWQKAALISPLVLGEEHQIKRHARRTFVLAGFICGLLMMMGLFHLSLYLLRPKELANLYCSLSCISWSVFMFFGAFTNWTASALFPEMPWHVSNSVEFVSVVIGSMIMIVIYHAVFPDDRFKRLEHGFLILGGIFVILTIILPPRDYYFITLLYYYIIVAIVFYLLVIVLLDVSKRKADAWFLVPGYLGAALAGVNDCLVVLGYINTPRMTPYGLLFFILSLSFLISYRSARAYKTVEALSSELEQKNIALVQADRLKDEFLANTSHELRTPLNGIIGLADSLLNGAAGKISQAMKTNLAMISASGKRLANLINDILDFSKLKNHEITLNVQPVDIKSLADIVIAFSVQITHDAAVVIENRMPDNLPKVLGDEDRLQQVLYNLVGNAVKFTQAGAIVLSADEKDGRVRVSVSDTGTGIPPDKHESIFNPFEQADASISRPFLGAGLGLGISRKLIELHDGELWLEASSEKGSTFCFTLPKSNARNAEPGRRKSHINGMLSGSAVFDVESPYVQPGNGAADLPADAPHVLVVDDDPVNLQVAVNCLSMEGIEVSTANCGKAAFALIEADNRFDMILLDIMMPEISGLDVCRQLRERYSAAELPILMLTAKNRLPDLLEGLACGANDYVVKPFATEELLARVRTQLTVRNAYIALQENQTLKDRIKQQKETELYLRLTKRRLAGMLDTIDDAIATVNGSGEVWFVNKIFESRFGYSSDTILGKPFEQFPGKEAWPKIKTWITEVFEKDQLFSNEKEPEVLDIRKSDGNIVKSSVFKARLELDDELLLVLIFREPTENGKEHGDAFIGSKYIIDALNLNRDRLRTLENSLCSLTMKPSGPGADFEKDLHAIDNALEQLGTHLENRQSHDKRKLAVALMSLSLETWCASTSGTKADFARSSGLWTVYVNKDGNERTQTLDRYLAPHLLPKRPRWEQVIKSAEFILESCDLTPSQAEQLETLIAEFRGA